MKRILTIFVLGMLLMACGKEQAKKTEKKNTLVYAQLTEAKTLDPHLSSEQYSQRVTANIYDRLVEVDDDMKLVPSLAESWEILDDLSMQFNLKHGVLFHSGKEFKATDVKFSLERAMKSPNLGSLYSLFDEIKVIDDYTVVIKTKKPFGALLYHLTHKSASILNEQFVKEHNNDINQIADGTGGYIFESWTPGEKIVLKRNVNYFKGKPNIEYIEVISVPEENSKVIGLETGEIDISADLESISRRTVLENEDLELTEVSSFSVQFLGMNMEKGYLKDPKVREAIALAIDKKIIIDTILMGAAEEANSFLAPGVFGYSKEAKTYGYDPEKARKILKDEGYENIKLSILTSNSTTRTQICEVLQSQLKEVGIDLEIKILEWGAFLADTSNGNSELYMLGWSPSTGDGDYGLVPNIHSSNKGAGGNRSFYENKRVDELLDLAKEELDLEKRKELYFEAQDLINEDAAVYPIYYKLSNAGVRKEVKGYVQTAADYPTFYRLSF